MNNLEKDLSCRQQGTKSSILVKPEEFKALHYLKPAEEHFLSIKLDGLINEWSQPFVMNQIGVLYLKLGKTGSEEEDLIRVEIILDGATLFIGFSHKSDGRWPISIENTSDQDVVVWQVDCQCHYLVQKNSVRNYAWDKPSVQRKILIVHVNGREREIDVSDIGHISYVRYPMDMKGSSFRVISVQVVADGPVLIIRIAHWERRSSEIASSSLTFPSEVSSPSLASATTEVRRPSNTDSLASVNQYASDVGPISYMLCRSLKKRKWRLLDYLWKGLEFHLSIQGLRKFFIPLSNNWKCP